MTFRTPDEAAPSEDGAAPLRDGGSWRGAGLLWQVDVERVELGEHAWRLLTARVGLGSGRALRLTLGQRRAVAIELHADEPARLEGGRYDESDLWVTAPPDPWLRAARGVLLVGAGCWLVTTVAARMRHTRRRRRVQLVEEG